MRDQYDRSIDYMRISVTDRCNLRCKYCMPEGIEKVSMQQILTLLGAIKNLMKNLGMSAEQAMTALGVSDAARGVLSKRI